MSRTRLAIFVLTVAGCAGITGIVWRDHLANRPVQGDPHDAAAQVDDAEISVIVEIPLRTPRPFTNELFADAELKKPLFGLLKTDAAEIIPLLRRPAGTHDSTSPLVARSYLVRGTLRPSQFDALQRQIPGSFVFPNVRIGFPTRESHPYGVVGNENDVIAQLGISAFWDANLKGKDVLVGVVDLGFSVEELAKKGKRGCVDKARHPIVCFDSKASRSRLSGVVVGATSTPASHGTMVAYASLIAAPLAYLADFPVPIDDPRLSDVIDIYGHVQLMVEHTGLLRSYRGVILVNSWAVFDPPRFDPKQRYIGNSNHPFNAAVRDLASLGVDVVFAAGDCGRQGGLCNAPDGADVKGTIYGANSHPDVLSVGSVTVDGEVPTYSSFGPGWLAPPNKPDLVAYADFREDSTGPGAFGTSAAAPLAAGVLAVYRSKVRYNPADEATWPDKVRERLRSTTKALDGGDRVWTKKAGWGILDAAALFRTLSTTPMTTQR